MVPKYFLPNRSLKQNIKTIESLKNKIKQSGPPGELVTGAGQHHAGELVRAGEKQQPWRAGTARAPRPCSSSRPAAGRLLVASGGASMAWWWSALAAEAVATPAVVVASPEALPMAWWWPDQAAAVAVAPQTVALGILRDRREREKRDMGEREHLHVGPSYKLTVKQTVNKQFV